MVFVVCVVLIVFCNKVLDVGGFVLNFMLVKSLFGRDWFLMEIW